MGLCVVISYLLCVMSMEIIFVNAGNFTCLSCSYTRSSRPETGYSCILNPSSRTTVNCAPPNVCFTVANYNIDGQYITSVTRNCYAPLGQCDGDNCCIDSGHSAKYCEDKCGNSNCNTFNPEAWLSIVDGNSNLPGRASTTPRSGTTAYGVTGNGNVNGPNAANTTSGLSTVIRIHKDLFHVDTNAGYLNHHIGCFQFPVVICSVMITTRFFTRSFNLKI